MAVALFLGLLPAVLRADDTAAGKSPKAEAKGDPAREGKTGANGSAEAPAQAVPQMEEGRLKALLAKYDANRDGQLDDGEKKKLEADLAAWTKKYKQVLAKYDANKNGELDPEEKEELKKDEKIAERNERRLWAHQAEVQQKLQQRLRTMPPRDISPVSPRR
jgi:hypothetical protein